MKLKEMFGAKKAPDEEPQETAETKAESSEASDAEARVNELLHELTALEKSGRLSRPVPEYLSEEVFCEDMFRFGAEPAVIICDLKQKLKNAEAKARADAQDEMRRRKNMPRPIRGGTPLEPETDFSKLTSEEFENVKKRIAKG